MIDTILFNIFEYISLLFFGLCFGSFATFAGHRIFSETLSIKGARSVCPNCKKTLAKRTMVPLFSYIFYRGKCLFCKNKISLRYPLIELGMGLCTMFIFYKFDYSLKTAALMILCTCVFIQIAIDVEYYMASDFIDFIMLLAVAILCYVDGKNVYDCALFSFCGAIFMLFCRQIVMWRIGEDPLGMGDVKIVAVMAPLATSGLNLLTTMGLFGVIGVFFGTAWKKHTKSEAFPFAPPIMIAFLLNYFFLARYY